MGLKGCKASNGGYIPLASLIRAHLGLPQEEPSMFVTPAFAQTAAAPVSGDIFSMLMPMALIMVVFYFLLIRPQQKRVKEHQQMVANLRRGDRVVTNGGLVGKVAKVEEAEILVDLAENVQVRVLRSAIADVRVKGEPVKDAAAEGAKK